MKMAVVILHEHGLSTSGHYTPGINSKLLVLSMAVLGKNTKQNKTSTFPEFQ